MRLWLVGLTLTLALSAGAQTPTPGAPAKAPSDAGTIFERKDELKLSDDQVSQLRKLMDGFRQDMAARAKLVNDSEAQVQELTRRKADLRDVAEAVRQAEVYRFTYRYLDLLNSRKIEAVLTPAQLEQWRALQAKARAELKK